MANPSEATFYTWDVDSMVTWLREENLHDCVRPFLLKKINGISFLNLSEFDLKTFQISAESKRKLTKVLKRIKAKKRTVHKSIENLSVERREPRSPSAIPSHVHQDDGDIDDWGSDFDSADESDLEGDESDGEYIEPEGDESQQLPTKEIPNVRIGLVAQLRAGLNGTIQKNLLSNNSTGHFMSQTGPAEGDDEIYDMPPDEELYEEPSDDSGSGIVVRPMDKKKVIPCSSSERGEYIDARAPKYSDKDDAVPCPPPPGRPPKSGPKLVKPPPAKRQPTPPPEPLEIYEQVQDEEQPGCSKVVAETPGGVEVYEPWDDGPTVRQETYEILDNPPQDTYEAVDQEGQETYEIPDPEPEPPGRPPPRGTGWNPVKKIPEQDMGRPSQSKKLGEQKTVKPLPASKPQFSPKPILPNPPPEKRSSRLYPNTSKTVAGPKKSELAGSIKRQSGVLAPPPAKQVSSPPFPPQSTPMKKEENNNEKRIIDEILSKRAPGPKLPPPRKSVSLEDESPPLPPRPGSKHPAQKARRLSDSGFQDEPGSTSTITRSPLPPLPSQPKSPNDKLKNHPWFHGPLDKKIAEEKLKAFSKEGAFIVRNSSKDPDNYSMSFFCKGIVKHLRMPRINNKFVLGDSGKVEFNTIEELVAHYRQNQVDLKSGGSTTLTVACPVE